eukprot:1189590-Prorocentrum_minimum.AAC.1
MWYSRRHCCRNSKFSKMRAPRRLKISQTYTLLTALKPVTNAGANNCTPSQKPQRNFAEPPTHAALQGATMSSSGMPRY